MKGIILAGGNGTRLRPATHVINKHLLPVYDKLMIEYPLDTLISLGCTDILIVTGGEHIGGFASYLSDGSTYGVRLTYRVQPRADGVAEALGCAEGFIDDYTVFPVILGDNYFEEPTLSKTPAIIVSPVSDPYRFGVYDPATNRIEEKPEQPKTNLAVTGLYYYDYKIFPWIRRLRPSERSELEISDINNLVLDNGGQVKSSEGYWSDMGTHESLMRTANYLQDRAHGAPAGSD